MLMRKRKVSLGFADGEFEEGHHIIYVYNDDHERKLTIAKFLQQGFLDEEKVLYLLTDISSDDMKQELQHLGVDIDGHQQDFDLSAGHYSYCPDNCFSSDFMLGIVAEYYDKALEEGYMGARGAGEMSWALEEGRSTVPELLNYEAELNNILTKHPLTTICQYDARRFDGSLIMDVMSVHPLMIVRGQLVKNPYYISPAEFLKEYNERRKRNAF